MKRLLLLIVVLIVTPTINASESQKLLEKVISNFKTSSASGFSIEYYGQRKMRSAHQFEGDVRFKWSTGNKFQVDGIRVKGTYHLHDVLGKRDEKVDIYVLNGEFWKIFHDQKEFLYSPNLDGTLSNTFKSVSPLLIFNALSFMLEHQDKLKQAPVEGNGNLTNLSADNGKTQYNIWIDKAQNIQKVIWIRSAWDGGEIVGEMDATHKSSIRGGFEKPTLADYQKKIIPTIGFPAPSWESSYYEGGKVNLDDLKGKVVLMDFWATWCSPCIRAIPALEKLHQKFDDKGLVVLGLNYHEKRKNPKKFMDRLNATYPIIDAEIIGLDYGIVNWPTTFIVDKKGIIRDAFFGYHDEETDERIMNMVTKLVSE